MSLHFYTYNCPFTSEFIQAKGSMGSSREGILIEWKHSMGSAWGECAPLPGFSSESLKDCERMLVSHKKKLEEQLHLLQAHLPKEKSNNRLSTGTTSRPSKNIMRKNRSVEVIDHIDTTTHELRGMFTEIANNLKKQKVLQNLM